MLTNSSINLVGKLGGRGSGFENWRSQVLKVQQKKVRSIIPGKFYLIYTNLSISAKSPLWKVFSPHISLHYKIIIIFHGDPTPKSGPVVTSSLRMAAFVNKLL